MIDQVSQALRFGAQKDLLVWVRPIVEDEGERCWNLLQEILAKENPELKLWFYEKICVEANDDFAYFFLRIYWELVEHY